MCDKEEMPSSVAEELQLYAQTTSLVGPAQVVDARQRWVKLFWVLAFIAALGMALFQVSSLIIKYQRFEIATEVSIKTTKRQKYPHVTICNLNPMEMSKAKKHPETKDLISFWHSSAGYNETQRDIFFGDDLDQEEDPECKDYYEQLANEEKKVYEKQINYDHYDDYGYYDYHGSGSSSGSGSGSGSDDENGEDNLGSRSRSVSVSVAGSGSGSGPDSGSGSGSGSGLGLGSGFSDYPDYGWYDLNDKQMELAEKCQGKGEKDDSSRLLDVLRERLATMKWPTIQNLSQSRDAFIVDCIFNGTKCTTKDFTYIPSIRYGRCLEFPEKNVRTFNPWTNSPGPSNGLTLLLFLNTEEYTFAMNLGARIDIHAPDTSSYPYENGFYVQPGKMNSIGIRQINIDRLGLPWGKCINLRRKMEQNEMKILNRDYPHILEMKNYYKLTSYSTQDCKSICLYEEIKDKCKCIFRATPHASPMDPDRKKKNGLEFCTSEDSKCLRSVQGKSRGGDLYEACGKFRFPQDRDLQCPSSCSEIDYVKEISAAQYPSIHNFAEVADILSNNTVTRKFFDLPSKEDLTEKDLTENWYEDTGDGSWFVDVESRQEFEKKVIQNIVKVNIFFKELNFQQVKEKPDYELVQLVSDLGGNTGLWVGFCVLTIVEWIVLLVNLCYVFCSKQMKSKITPGENNGFQETIKL